MSWKLGCTHFMYNLIINYGSTLDKSRIHFLTLRYYPICKYTTLIKDLLHADSAAAPKVINTGNYEQFIDLVCNSYSL